MSALLVLFENTRHHHPHAYLSLLFEEYCEELFYETTTKLALRCKSTRTRIQIGKFGPHPFGNFRGFFFMFLGR